MVDLKKLRMDALEVYLTLCQTGSFSNTARLLRRSQGGVSQVLKVLEQQVFGCRLVNRSSREFSLTSEGVLVRGFAESTLRLLKDTMRQIDNLRDEASGTIKISTSTTPGEVIVPRLISQFKEDFPRVEFDVMFNNTRRSIELVGGMDVDFAFVGSTKDLPPSVEHLTLAQDRLVVIADHDHPLFKGGAPKSWNQILKYPFILREDGSATREEFLDFLADLGERRPNMVLDLNDNHAIINALEGSPFLTVVSSWVAELVIKSGRAREVSLPGGVEIQRPLSVVWRPDSLDARVNRQFLEFVRKWLNGGELRGGGHP
ncbi:MAG: selenium metabolism-associated LysR family transcriptional regulator [Promethearchaeota archaeon]